WGCLLSSGAADLGGTYSWYNLYRPYVGLEPPPDATTTLASFGQLFTHELGHHFGALHSSNLYCNNGGQQTIYNGSCGLGYGDGIFTTMSPASLGRLGGSYFPDHMGFHKKLIGMPINE